MGATAEAVDWKLANVTLAAKRANKPENIEAAVRVPRNEIEAIYPLPWEELCARAFAGEQGLSPWLIYGNDQPPVNTAYVVKGDGCRAGKWWLHIQGWDAHTPADAA